MPASVEKLYTTATALLLYGAEGQLTTTVLATGAARRGGRASTATSCSAAAATPRSDRRDRPARRSGSCDGGLNRVTGRVVGDESAFDAFRGVPASHYPLTSDVGPLSALSYNHGRTGAPAVLAGRPRAVHRRPRWPRRCARRGVKIGARARAGRASAGMTAAGGVGLAHDRRDRPARCSRRRTTTSPRCWSRTSAPSTATPGSTSAGAAVVRRRIARFEITPTVVDGSGLSRLRPHLARARSSSCSPAWRDRRRAGVRRRARRRGPHRHGLQPHARHGGPGPLPHQDRHAARRLLARRLLHHARRRTASRSRS